MLAQAATSSLSPTTIVVIVVVAIVIVGAVFMAVRQRSQRLRSKFGPEYERTVASTGSRERAEAELSRREKRVRRFELSPLPAGARERYAEEWRAVQARFVDDPQSATADADRLLLNVMRDRGYPMEDFEQRAADLSVDHASDIQHYRAAHDISLKNDRGEATTEDLRQALVHYRALFESLLQVNTKPTASRVSA